ncbi:MAG TPA: pseudouridine synthase [Burkholderiales bacterium]|nr:pseudouridine synthase [Burkholderiales bacterium]
MPRFVIDMGQQPELDRRRQRQARLAHGERASKAARPGVILFNKPYGVVTQFSAHPTRPTLEAYIDIRGFYPAGRLDWDSEGLLILTNDGRLQHRISHPTAKLPKTYLAQVEGLLSNQALEQLRVGVPLADGVARPALADRVDAPAGLWTRTPPIRVRRAIPTSWLTLTITEGRNRQVRRMTAAVGFPTLRLVRIRVGPWALDNLGPGDYVVQSGAQLDRWLTCAPAAQSPSTFD